MLDAVRLCPRDDAIAVTAAPIRETFQRLYVAGQWQIGDPPVLVVADAGYDVTRLPLLLTDLPVEMLGRKRSDRVLYFPPQPQPPGKVGRKPKRGTSTGRRPAGTRVCGPRRTWRPVSHATRMPRSAARWRPTRRHHRRAWPC